MMNSLPNLNIKNCLNLDTVRYIMFKNTIFIKNPTKIDKYFNNHSQLPRAI